jgi:hypothetical protein
VPTARNLKFTLRDSVTGGWTILRRRISGVREGEVVSVDHAEWYSLGSRVLNPIKEIAAEPGMNLKQLSSAQRPAHDTVLRFPLSTMCFPVLPRKLWTFRGRSARKNGTVG